MTKKNIVKRPASQTDWLSDAASMRKKAAANVAMSKMSDKQRREQVDASKAYPEYKGGVFFSREYNAWYALDADGKNPSLVSGMGYFDPYFNEVRVWDNVQQRERAIASYESLVAMRDM